MNKKKDAFTKGLSHSKTLQTLVDADNHVDHGIQIPLTELNAQYIMSKCRSLKKIFTNQRIWTVSGFGLLTFYLMTEFGLQRRPTDYDFYGVPTVTLERRSSNKHGSLWFIPRE